MRFIYYAPRGVSSSPISYAFNGSPVTREVYAKGPDGGAGFLMFDNSLVTKMAAVDHLPDRQVWRQIPGEQLYVGHYIADPPTPEELQRPEMLSGTKVKLPDGNDWEIPVCRRFLESGMYQVALPQTMDLDANGEWVVDAIVAKHQRLWEASTSWFDFLMAMTTEDQDEVEVMVADVADSCTLALGTNYHVSKIEIAMLQLLTSTSRGDIMNATIDYSAISETVKKKRGGSASSHGVKGSTLTTLPA